MLRLALRTVLAHKLRLTLTALAIVLGVAFVSGTYVFTDSLKTAFNTLFEGVNEGIDLYVRGTQQFGSTGGDIDEEIVDQVREISGVELAVPSVEGIAQFVDKEGEPIGGNGPPTLGFSYLPEGESLTPVRIRDDEGGRWPEGPGEVVIDSFAADATEVQIGDAVDVILPIGSETFEVVGIATFGDADNLLGATLAIFEFDTAQRIFEREGRVSNIAIQTTPQADPVLVQAQIADLLPERVEVVTASQQVEDDNAEFAGDLGFVNTLLLVLAGVAVFVGAYIIQNTFRIIVAQRTRELAMLRAIGATARQVTWMVAIEAVIVGVVASAIGIGVGVLLAIGIRAAFSAFGFGIPSGGVTILLRTIVVGMSVGVIVTLVSSLLPARKAARVPPVAALRDEPPTARDLGRRITAGILVTVAGAILLLLGLFVEFDNAIAVVGLGALVAFVGVSILAPLAARFFARTAGSPLPRMFGVVGRLAQENAIRRPRRTAATASALMIGVALVSVIAVFSASAKAGVAEVFRSDFQTDLQVRLFGLSDPLSTGVSPAITDQLRQLDELDVVARMRLGEFRTREDGAIEFLLGVDGDVGAVVNLDFVDGSFASLTDDGVLLLDTEADKHAVAVGGAYRFQVPSGEQVALVVQGVFSNNTLGTPAIVTLDRFERHIDFTLDRFVLITAADGVPVGEARVAVEAVTEAFPNVEVTNTEELIADIEAQIDSVLNLLVVLLAFAILIALLGIVNTLVLSITERLREFGLLRAVGMARRQVKRMVRWEAVLIAVFGGVLGLVLGVLLGIAVVLALSDQGLVVAIPFGQLVVYLIAAAIGGILAAIIPARRGAKVNVLEALAYE